MTGSYEFYIKKQSAKVNEHVKTKNVVLYFLKASSSH